MSLFSVLSVSASGMASHTRSVAWKYDSRSRSPGTVGGIRPGMPVFVLRRRNRTQHARVHVGMG